MSSFLNEDGESLGTHRIDIIHEGEIVYPFSVGFSTSNVKDFQDRFEVYEDMAEALNSAHERRMDLVPVESKTYDSETWCKTQKECSWTGGYCICVTYPMGRPL